MSRKSARLLTATIVLAAIISPALTGCNRSDLSASASNVEQTMQDRRTDVNNVNNNDMSTKQNAASQDVQKLAAGYNQFGFRLLQGSQDSKGQNVFISPLSIASSLSMAANGARGLTRNEIGSTLGFGIQSNEQQSKDDKSNRDLVTSLKSTDPKVEISIANSLWARKGVSFKQGFLDRNRQFFHAEVQTLDFSSPATVETINHWVDDKTHHKINQIVKTLSADTTMMLINAVYFKGQWQRAFDKVNTSPDTFTDGNGKQAQVQMMGQSGKYLYQKDDHWQSVVLPYGSGQTSLYVFLPDEDSSLSSLVANLNQQNWERWLSGFSEKSGNIRIPKLKLEYESDLVPKLSDLGISAAFDPAKADFSEMTDGVKLFIQSVRHKTFLEVDEEGTTAAAVTSTEMRGGSAMRPQPFNFVVNRPFLIVIRDSETGAILFIGSIVKAD